MKKANIIWSSVISTAFAVAGLVSAYLNSVEWVVAFGFASLTAATLSVRER
jgi:hypothetical protein